MSLESQKHLTFLQLTIYRKDKGRANKGTANGLLAKLYLYQENFAGAITEGQKVINGPYPLAANYRDNFNPTKFIKNMVISFD